MATPSTTARLFAHARFELGEIPAEGLTRIPLMRIGSFRRGPGGGPGFEITPQTLAEIQANFARQEFKRVPIDLQHLSTEDAARVMDPVSTRAVGWVLSLDVDGDYLYGWVEWTEEGRRLVGSKAFAYISPTFSLRWTDAASGDQVGAYLMAAALTNTPFLDMPAVQLSDRAGLTPEITTAAVVPASVDAPPPEGAPPEESNMNEQEITALSERAAQAEATVSALSERAVKAESEVVALSERLAAVEDQKASLAREIEQFRAAKRIALRDRFFAEKRLTPAQWDAWGQRLAERDMSEFESVCASMPASLETAGSGGAPSAAEDAAPKSFDEAFALAEKKHANRDPREIAAIVARDFPGLMADYVDTSAGVAGLSLIDLG